MRFQVKLGFYKDVLHFAAIDNGPLKVGLIYSVFPAMVAL